MEMLNICYVIDVFPKYAWVKPLKDKKGKTVLNPFVEIVNESNCKPNNYGFSHGREFYIKVMQEDYTIMML